MIYLNVVALMLSWYWLVNCDYDNRRWTYVFDGMLFSWNLAEVLIYCDHLVESLL